MFTRKFDNNRLLAALCMLLLALSSFATSACSSNEATVADRMRRKTVVVTAAQCDPTGQISSSNSLLNGEVIEIPAGLGTYSTYELNYPFNWYPGSDCEKMQNFWQDKGGNYSPEGFATVDGRAIIATTPKFGEVGQIVDFYLSDGSVVHTVKGDNKSLGDPGCTEWGHDGGQCILEFIGDLSKLNCSPLYYVYGVPANGDVTTVKAVIGGNVFDGDSSPVNAVREEGVSSSAGSRGVASSSSGTSSSVKGSYEITSHHDWAYKGGRPALEPTPPDFPIDSYKSTGSHDGTPGDASKVNIDKSHMNDASAGHGELVETKYIVLHTTESGAGATPENIMTAWDNATGDRKGVAAHFIVDYDGKIYQYVSENLVCWHAGAHGDNAQTCSCSNHTEFPEEVIANGLNNYSIGIEINHNQGEKYPEAQLEAVDNLIAYLGGGGVSESVDQCAKDPEDPAGETAYDAKTGNEIVDRAYAQLGKDYVWGAVGPDTYDCSGLVGYCLTGNHERIGNTTTYMGWAANGMEVSASEAKPGDFLCNDHHCGIYVGDGQMIHAADYGIGVILSQVDTSMIYIRYDPSKL